VTFMSRFFSPQRKNLSGAHFGASI